MSIIRFWKWLFTVLVTVAVMVAAPHTTEAQETWQRSDGSTRNLIIAVRRGFCSENLPAGVWCWMDYSRATGIPVAVWYFTENVTNFLRSLHTTMQLGQAGFVGFRWEPMIRPYGGIPQPDVEFFIFNFRGMNDGVTDWLSNPVQVGTGVDANDNYTYPALASPVRYECTNTGYMARSRVYDNSGGSHCSSCNELRAIATRLSTGDSVAVFFDGVRYTQVVGTNYEFLYTTRGDYDATTGMGYSGARVQEAWTYLNGTWVVSSRTCALKLGGSQTDGARSTGARWASLGGNTDIPSSFYAEDLYGWVDRQPLPTIREMCGSSGDPFGWSVVFPRPEVACNP